MCDCVKHFGVCDWFLTCFLLRPALRNHEGGDGAPAGRHAADRSTVRLLPQEAGE